ncbi:TPA: type I restriction endonuclease subunit R, partial [Staphylococcus aureus]|nr:type I restriction endonuclease subunit R [Staphylococcus aureus]
MIKNKEINFEQDIEASLVQYGGWESVRFQDTHYDANIALDPTVLLEFVKQTQPKNWKRYVSIYRTNAEQKFLKRLNEEITNHGILHVLRKGIRDRGVSFKVVYFQPASSLNTENIKNYEANRFQCVRQFQYSNKYRNTIDMVLMINGIPLVALELK